MTTLEDARQDLAKRYQAADAAGDFAERDVLNPLADVADYVCRIGDHRDSAYYSADKAGALLHAAIRLQRETLTRYADDEGIRAAEQIEDGARRLDELAEVVIAMMWDLARGNEVSLDGLVPQVRRLEQWAAKVETR